MRKLKLVFLQTLIAISLISTSVFAAVTATIDVTASNTTVKTGDTITVTLSAKNVNNQKIESIEGYINYNKDVIEPIDFNSIKKNSDGKTVTIGTETLPVENLTDMGTNIPETAAYVAFNGNPASDNDSKIVIDFAKGLRADADLLKIDFKIKSDARLGSIQDAISYSMFIITAGSETSTAITKNISLNVSSNNTEPTPSPIPSPTPSRVPTPSPTPSTKTLSSISITTKPTKTNYTEGEKFDTKGMVIKATYSDGTVKTITNYEVIPSGSLTTGDNTVTIRYTENGETKEVGQTIKVSAAKNNNTTNNNTANNNTVKNTNTNTDGTVASGKKIPATGAKIIIIPLLILVVLAYISYNKYSSYKDI